MAADDNVTHGQAGHEARDHIVKRPGSSRRSAVEGALQRYLAGELVREDHAQKRDREKFKPPKKDR